MRSEVIHILEDNDERIAAFEAAVAQLKPAMELRLWREAHSFISEAGHFLQRTVLISLDHDLNRLPGATRDPGDGLEVATWLAQQRPVCPVIVHSSNHERVESMINELRFGGWTRDRVAPFGNAAPRRLPRSPLVHRQHRRRYRHQLRHRRRDCRAGCRANGNPARVAGGP